MSIGSAFLGKVPPHSEEAEVAILGAILLDNTAMDTVDEIVTPGDFYSDAHGALYRVMRELLEENRPVDLTTLADGLKDRGELEAVGGVEYLDKLLDVVATTAHADAYARTVAEKAMVRRCIAVALDILQKGYGEYGDAREFVDRVSQALDEAGRERSQSQMTTLREALGRTVQKIDEEHRSGDRITGITSGYGQIDKWTGGLQRRELSIVAGRPSMGKTAFAQDILERAGGAGHHGAFFSLEMDTDGLVRRSLSRWGKINGTKLQNPHWMNDQDLDEVIEASDRIFNLPIHIDDSADLTVLNVRNRARRLKRKHGLDLVVIDYLQIMDVVQGRKDSTRDRDLADITRRLKALAKGLDIHVMVLSQLNRGPEARHDKRPRVADLRESGAIEQDADLIMLLYREAAYNRDSTDNTAEVIIGKNRNGPVGTINLAFQKEFTRFDELADDSVWDEMPSYEQTQMDPPEQTGELF